LPKIIKIDLYNFELYRFKVGAFFETQCIIESVDSQIFRCLFWTKLWTWWYFPVVC